MITKTDLNMLTTILDHANWQYEHDNYAMKRSTRDGRKIWQFVEIAASDQAVFFDFDKDGNLLQVDTYGRPENY